MRLSNGFVIDKEKTFGELKFTAVRDVFLQNEDGTPSTQLKKRIYYHEISAWRHHGVFLNGQHHIPKGFLVRQAAVVVVAVAAQK